MITNNDKIGIEEYNKVVDPKSVIISGDVHMQLKKFCKSKGIKISFLLEKLFLNYKDQFLEDEFNKRTK